MTGRLENKTALITGTAQGQGRAAALLFASEGARIIGCDTNADEAARTVEMVRQAGGQMDSLHPLDLSQEPEVERWIDFASRKSGGFDILYNNAATFARGRAVAELTREEWDFSFANEVSLIFLAVKHALPVFRSRGHGTVLNIASVAGMVGSGLPANAAGNLVHAVFKGAVIRLTECLAVELAPLNVRVNSISPGVIETPAIARFVDGSDLREVFERSALLPRMGKTTDIAWAALYLVSDEASWVTGINLPVDGGFTASGGLGAVRPEVQKMFAAADVPGLRQTAR